MTNLGNVPEEIKQEDSENAISDKEKKTRFKNEEELANHRELIEKMIEKGLLPPENKNNDHNYNDYSRHPTDIPNLLVDFKRWKKGINSMEQNEIRDHFSACNILTEEVGKILMVDESQWFKVERNNSSAVLALAMIKDNLSSCLLYTSPSPRDRQKSRMPSSA